LAPVHVPLWHVSVWVHALPSLHVVPLPAVGFEHAPVVGLHVPAAWHWSLAVQVTGLEPAHTPDWHESACVHALPSLQEVPFGRAGLEQAPLDGSHVPATWHWSAAKQMTGLDPVQAPLSQLSVSVQALPSLQVVPFAAVGFEHAPVLGSHVPAVWHWSSAVQVTGLAPMQAPLWQASLCVQALPSLQVAPFAASGLEQAPLDGSHVPATWH
jgi:hypothetical protein